MMLFLAFLGLGFDWELETRVRVRVLGSVVKKVAISGGGVQWHRWEGS